MATTTQNDDIDSDFIGDPNGGDGEPRANDEEDEPCSSCGQLLLWDCYEGMVYCVNDWYHL